MNTIKQRAAKGAVGWPSASEIIVAKSLLWWIWEIVVHRRSASSNAYPTLMPPENSRHCNWTSSAATVHTSNGTAEQRPPWGYTLLLVTIGTIAGTCILHKSMRKALETREKAALVAKPKDSIPNRSRKALKVETLGMSDEERSRSASLNHEMLAMSPIQEVASPFSLRSCLAANGSTLAQATNLVEVPRQTQIAGTKMNKLVLSEIILTIDIPPSPPKQEDDDAMVQLSEMLQKW